MLKGNTSHISQTLTFSHPIVANRGPRYYFVSHYHFADRERTPQMGHKPEVVTLRFLKQVVLVRTPIPPDLKF